MNKKLLTRFTELAGQAKLVDDSEHSRHDGLGGHSRHVDDAMLLEWRVKVKNLLVKACGDQSEHMKAFIACEQAGSFMTNLHTFERCRAVFNAAKEDFEGGYLASLEEMVQAEVFDHELDQARELFKFGYVVPAAVVAGVVLETTVRGMCARHGVSIGSLERMNADLAKAGCYNVLVQKQVTAMAHVRNKAAHGETDQFTKADVEALLNDVVRFVAGHVAA